MKNNRRPLIGITGPDKGGAAAWFFTMLSIRWAGGIPKRITPSRDVEPEELDGLILGGGADIDPKLYGETLKENLIDEDIKKEPSGKRIMDFIISLLFFPFLYIIRKMTSVKYAGIDHHRDELESSLLKITDKRNLPVLGICRGMQFINTYYGGTLHQNISNFYGEKPQITSLLPKKKILIKEGSCLERILHMQECRVNALHKQAVNKIGEKLVVAAQEETEIIQAIEHTEKEFMVGVQWHPEYLMQVREQRRIFKALVVSAASHNEKMVQ